MLAQDLHLILSTHWVCPPESISAVSEADSTPAEPACRMRSPIVLFSALATLVLLFEVGVRRKGGKLLTPRELPCIANRHVMTPTLPLRYPNAEAS